MSKYTIAVHYLLKMRVSFIIIGRHYRIRFLSFYLQLKLRAIVRP